ncbi:MAG: DUF4870 domain-containing protein [Anaerolineae bacterium]
MAEEMVGTPVGGGEVTDDDKLWALLSWLLWPVAIIVLLMEDKKSRPFIKYHAVNSLAYSVVWYIVGTITVGCLWVVGAIYAIYVAIKAYQGEWVEVPVISNFVRNQGWA